MKKKKWMSKLKMINLRQYFVKMCCMYLALFVAINLCGATSNYAQLTMISLNMKDVNIKTVFEAIEQNSEFIFFYQSAELDTDWKVSINAENQPINEILSQLFDNTEYGYLISDRQVFIAKKEVEKSVVALPEQQPGIPISGIVKDETGELLPGVTITVKGTTAGTATDANGKYSINVPGREATLVFSYVGYIPQEYIVGNRTVIDVSLFEDTQQIEEVVVIGYGTQKKESIVGAISQVKGTDLVRGGTTSVGTSLVGRVPGMVTVTQTGLPGANDPVIYIRGVSSFTGNNQPLVMVDGIERPLADIDPSEVESISVLKDASATAVFGVRGGNGVILITTKRGQEGRMEISVNVDATLKQTLQKRIQEDSYTTLSARNQSFRYRNMWDQVMSEDILDRYRNRRDEWDQYIYPDVDVWNFMVRPFVWDNRASISARGGNKKAKYYLTLSYMHEGDVLESHQTLYDPSYKYDRINYRMNFDFDLTNSTKLSISSAGMVGKYNYGGDPWSGHQTQMISALYLDPPYLSPYIYPAAFVEHYPDPDNPVIKDRLAPNILNPGKNLGFIMHNYSGTTESLRDRLGADIVLNQKLDFITKGLQITADFSYNNYCNYTNGGIAYSTDRYVFQETSDGYQWLHYSGSSINPFYVQAPPSKRNYSRGTPSYDYEYKGRLDYNRTFGDHTVTGLAMFGRRIAQSGSAFPRYEEKWSGRITYDYQAKYLLEATIGISGSERFAPANRFGYFPALAAGWVISRENFFKQLIPEQFNNLRVRYSYGLTGNDQVNDFLYISDYTNWNSYTRGYGTTSDVLTVREGAVPNLTAGWERSKKHNLGFDLGFFNSAVTISAELFSEYTDRILMSRNAVASWFGQEIRQLNLGETKRHGYEVELRYSGSKGKWFWWTSANINEYENRIVKRDTPLMTPDYQNTEGKPIGMMTSQINLGYFQTIDEMMNYSLGSTAIRVPGSDWNLDFNGDGTSSNDAVPMPYNERPRLTYSISGGVNYNQFELNFLIQGTGKTERNWTYNYNPLFSRDADNLYVMVKGRQDIWTPANPDADHANWMGWSPADKAIVDASYLRLKTLEIAYTFDKRWLKTIGISSARIALQGYNLLTYAPGYLLGDPENEPTGIGEWMWSFYYYPIPRRYTLALKFTF